jgi:hypothetical protein
MADVLNGNFVALDQLAMLMRRDTIKNEGEFIRLPKTTSVLYKGPYVHT